MTLLYFDGCQDASVARKPEWLAGATALSSIGRDGSTNGSMGLGNATLALPSTATTCIVGFGFNMAANQFGGTGLRLVCFSNAAGTQQLTLVINTTGQIEARKGTATGTLLGTSSGHDLIQGSTWQHLQVKATLHLTAGVVEVRLDGVTVLSLSGVSTSTATADTTHVSFNSQSGSGANFQIDDLYILDAVDATATQGRANNNYLGDLKVTTLIPTANGDLTAWSKSTGTVSAALVDEVPPNTTDYIFSSTVAQRELMVLPDLSGTTGNVYGVRVSHYSLKSDAGASSVKTLVKESGGTITAQSAKALSTTAAAYAGEFLFTKPSAPTTPWTAADVNGLQAGVELA
jgi:hypothetical protein